MIELISIIGLLAILAAGAVTYYLDFRRDAMKSAAINFVNYLQSSLKIKQTQVAMYCGGDTEWPRIEALLSNDITENGSLEAICTFEEIPAPRSANF